MIYGNPESEIMILQLNNYENLYFTIHFYVKTRNADFIFHSTLYSKKSNSQGARGIFLNLVLFNALGSKYMGTKVKSVANSFQELFHSRHFVRRGLGCVNYLSGSAWLQHSKQPRLFDDLCKLNYFYWFTVCPSRTFLHKLMLTQPGLYLL